MFSFRGWVEKIEFRNFAQAVTCLSKDFAIVYLFPAGTRRFFDVYFWSILGREKTCRITTLFRRPNDVFMGRVVSTTSFRR